MVSQKVIRKLKPARLLHHYDAGGASLTRAEKEYRSFRNGGEKVVGNGREGDWWIDRSTAGVACVDAGRCGGTCSGRLREAGHLDSGKRGSSICVEWECPWWPAGSRRPTPRAAAMPKRRAKVS